MSIVSQINYRRIVSDSERSGAARQVPAAIVVVFRDAAARVSNGGREVVAAGGNSIRGRENTTAGRGVPALYRSVPTSWADADLASIKAAEIAGSRAADFVGFAGERIRTVETCGLPGAGGKAAFNGAIPTPGPNADDRVGIGFIN